MTDVYQSAINIVNIGGIIGNNYILESPAGLVVIDTGYSGGFERFRGKFEGKGFRPGDIRFIVLTHAHDDHTGFLNELLGYTAAPVILHEAAVDRLKSGHNSFEGGCSTKLALRFCHAMALLGRGGHVFPPVSDPERYLIFAKDEQYLLDAGIGATIHALPGHTADSIGLLLPAGAMLCGDAAMNGFPSTANHTIWIECIADFQASWDHMLSLGCKTVYPGHGRPFTAENLKKNRDFLAGKRLIPLSHTANM